MPCLRGVKTQRLLDDCAGHTGLVRASDIVTAPVRLGAAIRNRRLFHPIGVVADGILERVAPPNEGLPMVSCDVIGRVSKGIGLRGALPDIAGLAWRMPPQRICVVARPGTYCWRPPSIAASAASSCARPFRGRAPHSRA